VTLQYDAKVARENSKSLIFVHERGFKPTKQCLMSLCTSAVQAGFERDYPQQVIDFDRLDKHLAYYGDISNQFLRSQGLEYDEALDIGDLENALAEMKHLKKRTKFNLEHYDRLPGKSSVSEFMVNVFEPLIVSLGLTERLVTSVGADFTEYWNPQSRFAACIRERVRDVITAAFSKNDKVLLVTHGTGCIVAYDVLWELSHSSVYSEQFIDNKIDLWLTLGAPLADAVVADRLFGAQMTNTQMFPNNIISWHNIAAEDDYMSHRSSLTNRFEKMLTQRIISTIKDYKISNLAVRYGRSNPHQMLGYLIHPRTTKIIHDWVILESAHT